MFKIIVICLSLLLFQACATNSSGIQRTGVASDLDGAWINETCQCDGKDDSDHKLQKARILFINGNNLIQQLTVRLKLENHINYCTILETAKLTQIDRTSIKIETTSEQLFAPDEQNCNQNASNISSRNWKILNAGKTDLKFESTSGCEKGPLVCTYKRLDK